MQRSWKWLGIVRRTQARSGKFVRRVTLFAIEKVSKLLSDLEQAPWPCLNERHFEEVGRVGKAPRLAIMPGKLTFPLARLAQFPSLQSVRKYTKLSPKNAFKRNLDAQQWFEMLYA